MNYDYFDLNISNSSNDVYSVSGETSSKAIDKDKFSFLLDDMELEKLRSLVDGKFEKDFLISFGHIIEKRLGNLEFKNNTTVNEFLEYYGELLYNRLFNQGVGRLYFSSYGRIETESEKGLRINLAINELPAIAALPWELLYNPKKKKFLANSNQTPLVRNIELPTSVRNFVVEPPVKVLVIIPGNSGLDFPKEKEIITKAFAKLADDKAVRIEFLEGLVTEDEIRKKLALENYHILHFTGHGDFKEGQGFLKIDRDPEGADYYAKQGLLSAEIFSNIVGNRRTINLVVLNACQGAENSTVELFKSVAEMLVFREVPAVVAMQHSIEDAAAIRFSREFYLNLCNGPNRGKVDYSISCARSSLYDKRNLYPLSFSTPVLYLRAFSGTIFDIPQPESAFLAGANFVTSRQEKRDIYVNTISSLKGIREEAPEEEFPAIDDTISKNEDGLAKIETEIRKWYWTFAGTVVAAFVIFSAIWFSVFSLPDFILEKKFIGFLDNFVEKSLHDDVRVILIDEDDNGELGNYRESPKKWREYHAQLLKKLTESEASRPKAMVFDTFLVGDADSPDIDSRLAREILDAETRGTKVIFGCFNFWYSPVVNPPQLLKDVITARCGSLDAVNKADSMIPGLKKYFDLYEPGNAEELKTSKAKQGISDFSLALKAVTEVNELKAVYNDDDRSIRFETLAKNSKPLPDIPLNSDYKMLINFVPYEDFSNFPVRNKYHLVLNGENNNDLSGKIVFIGTTIKSDTEENELMKNLTNGDERYGVEYHANVVSSILQGKHIRSMEWRWQSFAVIALLGAIGVLLPLRFGKLLNKFSLPLKIGNVVNIRFHLALIVVPLLYLLIMALLYVEWQFLFDMSNHIFAFFSAYFTGWLFRHALSIKRLQKVN